MRLQFYSVLLLTPVILISPLLFIYLSGFGLYELWELKENRKQYMYANLLLLYKVLSLLPMLVCYACFLILEGGDFNYMYCLIAFWVFLAGNVCFPLLVICRRWGVKRCK